MIAVGIITAPRSRPALQISVSTLRGNGGYKGRVIVSVDAFRSMTIPPMEGVCLFGNSPALGNFRNWVHCAQLLLNETTEPWVMVCEDDIVWADGAFPAIMEDIRLGLGDVAGAGCFSMYLPIRMSKMGEAAIGRRLGRGWHHKGMQLGKRMWGAQCLLFKRERLQALLSCAKFLQFFEDPQWSKNVDRIIAESIESMNAAIWWRVPCLVDHALGDGNSTLGYPDDRPQLRSAYFTGAA